MRRIDDERIRFYLRHQAEIDEWAAVGDDVHPIADAFYASLLPDVEAAAPEGVSVRLTGERWLRIALANPAWRTRYRPTVEVAFEWKRETAGFTTGQRRIGVRVARGEPDGPATVAALTEALADAREPAFASHGGHWPAFRQEPPPSGPWWDDLGPFREQLVGSLLEAWHRLAPPLSAGP